MPFLPIPPLNFFMKRFSFVSMYSQHPLQHVTVTFLLT